MALLDLLQTQLLDPFRIGLLLALAITSVNTSQQTGRAIPLLLGALFVAVLIPVTLRSETTGMVTAIAVGVVANAMLLGIIMAAAWGWARWKVSRRR
jgi:hypothetical protein